MKFQRIRDLREDADLTQSEMGRALHLPQRTYAYYESGQRTVPPEVLIALANFYGVSVDYILGRKDDKNQATVTRGSCYCGFCFIYLPLIRRRAVFSSRLTWAWLMPISDATSIWVLPSIKRL